MCFLLIYFLICIICCFFVMFFIIVFFFFFQAEDGIRDRNVTGVQTCALPICMMRAAGIPARFEIGFPLPEDQHDGTVPGYHCWAEFYVEPYGWIPVDASEEIGRASCRERV